MNAPKGAFDRNRRREQDRRRLLLIEKTRTALEAGSFWKPGIGYARTHGNSGRKRIPVLRSTGSEAEGDLMEPAASP